MTIIVEFINFVLELYVEILDNKIFNKYLFNDFLKNINSSILYFENEKHIYHNKMGILINIHFELNI